jgi:phosphoribosylanthranilate isomerase
MFRIKICGVRTPAEVEMCCAAGADALGFIFAESSVRFELRGARSLRALIPSHVARVGVFAGNPRETVEEAIANLQLDVLQFCGGESARFCGSFGLPTIHVAGVDAQRNRLPALPPKRRLQAARAGAILIDSRVNGKPGGSGACVDAKIARAVAAASPLPVILAGGLTPENVGAAVRFVRPRGVDVRSGVRRFGRIDATLVFAFVRAARSALQDWCADD